VLHELGINSISLDSIINDNNLRLVENMRAVAWNGLEAAFDVLERRWAGLMRPGARPFQVLILGTGMVGKHAVEAATKLGDITRNNLHIEKHGPGALALSIGRNLSANAAVMESLMRQADILVDASQRRDATLPVIPNAWLAWLPEHAVIVDLSVDPYLLDHTPPTVRGIEGIPMGNLDQYVFFPDDPYWEKTIPPSIPTNNRRTTVTCYSWPGIHPESCMEHYAHQMEPLMEVLLSKGYSQLSLEGGFFERALFRAKLPDEQTIQPITPSGRPVPQTAVQFSPVPQPPELPG
jgi:alanine dehydrogenase